MVFFLVSDILKSENLSKKLQTILQFPLSKRFRGYQLGMVPQPLGPTRSQVGQRDRLCLEASSVHLAPAGGHNPDTISWGPVRVQDCTQIQKHKNMHLDIKTQRNSNHWFRCLNCIFQTLGIALVSSAVVNTFLSEMRFC